VAVKLVSSDPALVQFLQPDLLSSSDPKSSNAAREVASAKVERAVSSLGKLEAEVIEALFPTSGAAPESFDSLASRLGMTVEQVKGVADNALRDLRGSRRSGLRLSPVWN
jgi:DNA-directed RNA polymerase sigma subunit (sigma70/sigma32)